MFCSAECLDSRTFSGVVFFSVLAPCDSLKETVGYCEMNAKAMFRMSFYRSSCSQANVVAVSNYIFSKNYSIISSKTMKLRENGEFYLKLSTGPNGISNFG